MEKCKHCGSSFWFSVGDTTSMRTTQGGTLCITAFWRCPACGQYNTLVGVVSVRAKEMADGYALPSTTHIRVLDEGVAADIEERLARAWA